MYEELLTEIGLTKSEIAVYLALLELGSSTTGPIIKKAGIASGKAYIVLDKLILKGLVTHAIKGGVKNYQAKDPERLLDYIREKQAALKQSEEKLVQLVTKLKTQYEQAKYQPVAEVFEGNKGFFTLYEWILKQLKKGECLYVMGIPKESNEKFNKYFLNWSKRRIALGVRIKLLYNHDSREFGKMREKMPLTEVRYMKEIMETPAWIDIFGDYVVTIITHGTPVCFLIRNKEAAESYIKYFDMLWKQAEK